MIFLFVLQEVLQFGVGLYTLQLVSDNLPDLSTDTVVVILDHLLHAIVGAGICKVVKKKNWVLLSWKELPKKQFKAKRSNWDSCQLITLKRGNSSNSFDFKEVYSLYRFMEKILTWL